MYAANFDYFRPRSVAEAVTLLSKNRGARVLAGGHSLLPQMKLRVASPAALIDIGRIKSLAGIRATRSSVKIGALTTHAAIAASGDVQARCAILAETAAQIGDLQVRNRGTLGGSLAHADPAADYPTVILALGATLTATGPRGDRDIPAEKFFKDLFTTALKRDEILTAVRIPAYGQGTGGAYAKHRHPASSYAVVGVAALVTLDDGMCSNVSLVVGGATANPVRAVAAQQALRGHTPDEGHIAAAAAMVAESVIDPLGDIYASGEYRAHLAGVLAKRALAAAVERARG